MTKKIFVLLILTLLSVTMLAACGDGNQGGKSVTNINLDAAQLNMVTGESITVTATVAPSGLASSVDWYSTDASVATVKNGVITAVSDGTVLIVCASDNGIFAKCLVTVGPAACIHEVDWQVVEEPTCDNSGTKKGICSICNEEQADTIPALEHELAHNDGKKPNCKEDGYTAYDYCTRGGCDYTVGKETLTDGDHEYTVFFLMGNPTATSSAIGMLSCSVSGCDYHSEKTVTVPALSSSDYSVKDLGGGHKQYTISLKNDNNETVIATFTI